jgi:uncharacterized membrane protein
MRWISLLNDDNKVEASVLIRRPVCEVFSFYRNFKNLPRFLGDVMNVELLDPITSRWAIQGSMRIRVHWMVRVTEERTNELIRYETVTSSRLKTFWEIYFAAGPAVGVTAVREVMRVPLGIVGRAALKLTGKFPAEEVASNLHRLKQVIETGAVTDTSHSVAGKFVHHLKQPE